MCSDVSIDPQRVHACVACCWPGHTKVDSADGSPPHVRLLGGTLCPAPRRLQGLSCSTRVIWRGGISHTILWEGREGDRPPPTPEP